MPHVAHGQLVEFPAHAGMNRRAGPAPPDMPGVPRTRGDEPTGNFDVVTLVVSSPHTRG